MPGPTPSGTGDASQRAGIVLAGGHSRRFGDREKALAEVGGDPMLARVIDRLGAVVDEVVVNCRRDQRPTFEEALADAAVAVRFAVDDCPGEGPLVGLRTALDAVAADRVAVVACDMPGLDPDLLHTLFDRATGRDGAVPEDPDGRLQPSQAVYHTDAMRDAADESLTAGERSLRRAVGRLDVAVVDAAAVVSLDARRSLRDVNTPEALAAFEREE